MQKSAQTNSTEYKLFSYGEVGLYYISYGLLINSDGLILEHSYLDICGSLKAGWYKILL